MTDTEEFDRFLRWMKGNEDAARFCYHFMYIIHLWDDLIDKDKTRTDKEINDAFTALFMFPRNEFYANHYALLSPIIMSSIHSFMISNEFEKGMEDSDLDISYGIRCNVLNVIVCAADIVGGTEWASEVGQEIWRTGLRQSLKEYKEELSCQV